MLGNGFLPLCSLITSTSNTYLLWGLAQVLPSPWSATRKSTDYCQKSWESEHLGVNPKRESYFTPGVSFVQSSVKWSQQWSVLIYFLKTDWLACLCWAAEGLCGTLRFSPVAEPGAAPCFGAQASQRWLLLPVVLSLQSAGPWCAGFSGCGTRA